MKNLLIILFSLITNLLQAQDCWTVINLDGNEKKIFMGEPPKSNQPYKINLAAALTDEQYESYPDNAKSTLKFTVLADGSTSDFKLLKDSPTDFKISDKQYNYLVDYFSKQKYEPGLCNGKVVDAPIEIPIIWKKK